MTGQAPHTYAEEQQLHHLRRSLTNHRPDAEQINRIEKVREVGYTFGVAIVEDTPPSRAQAIALTKLEEAVMWAVKAIVLEEKVED